MSVVRNWSYQQGDNFVLSNRLYHFDNIANGRYLLLLDTEIYTDDVPVDDPEAAIGFSILNNYFSTTRCNHKESVNISGIEIIDVFDNCVDIHVKAKCIDTYRFDHFKIILIPDN